VRLQAARSAGRRSVRLKGLLFDKDGTLFDFHATWSGWTRDLIRRLADGDPARELALAREIEFDLASGRFDPASPAIAGTPEVFVTAVLRVFPKIAPATLREHLIGAAAAVRPVDAAPLAPLLAGLRTTGMALGVATNDAEAAAREQLAQAGVLECFDLVLGYDSGFGAKPDAGMLLAFCASVGLAPAEVAMIGDSTHDLHAGRAAGMVVVAVLTGPAGVAELAPHADAVLPTIAALPDWLAAQAAPDHP
jgi:phosphoglycolate phosphatase